MWMGPGPNRRPEKLPLFFRRLREMGVNSGMIYHDGDAKPFVDARFPFYIENVLNHGLCLEWNSSVCDWDAFVTEWKDGRGEDRLIRDYSLDDPAWRAAQRVEVRGVAEKFAAAEPLMLDLRDELSTTILTNPFDYDFSPTALAGFRAWLQWRYRDLAALNAQWDTDFATWEDVRPFTTDQIKHRMAGGIGGGKNGAGVPRGEPDWGALRRIRFDPAAVRRNPLAWNFSPWCDHRTYMDLSLARALDDFRRAARSGDPTLPVGIEGTQMPSAFGGYDLWRLSQVVDWIEPYDIGCAREILGSFMPGKPIFTTVGRSDARAAQRRLWHLLLEGDAGCLVWWSEDCVDYDDEDYPLSARAKTLAPVLRDLQSPLAALFYRAEREIDPIAIHYSHASIQVDWLLESTRDGSTWPRRFSSFEAAHNTMAQRRQAWLKLLQDVGYTPVFVSSEQIERGDLAGFDALVLPDSLALSEREHARIHGFLRPDHAPRLILGSGTAHAFDEHGKARLVPDGSYPRGAETWYVRSNERGLRYGRSGFAMEEHLTRRGAGHRPARELDPLIHRLGSMVARKVWLTRSAQQREWTFRRPSPSDEHDPGIAVRIHRYQAARGTRLLAFERNVVWQMGQDLSDKGWNDALETPVGCEARLAAPGHVYELRRRRYLGRTDGFHVELDPWLPALYAVTAEKLPAGDVVETLRAAR